MVIKTRTELDPLVRQVLLASGTNERTAAIVADPLVLANLSGVDTQGLCCHLKGYVRCCRRRSDRPYSLA